MSSYCIVYSWVWVLHSDDSLTREWLPVFNTMDGFRQGAVMAEPTDFNGWMHRFSMAATTCACCM